MKSRFPFGRIAGVFALMTAICVLGGYCSASYQRTPKTVKKRLRVYLAEGIRAEAYVDVCLAVLNAAKREKRELNAPEIERVNSVLSRFSNPDKPWIQVFHVSPNDAIAVGAIWGTGGVGYCGLFVGGNDLLLDDDELKRERIGDNFCIFGPSPNPQAYRPVVWK